MKDEDIDFSNDAEITKEEAKFMRPNPLFYKPIKSRVNFMLDKDVVAWLRKHANASKYLNGLIKQEIRKH